MTIDNFFIAGDGAGGISNGSLSCSGTAVSARTYSSGTSFSGLNGLSLNGDTLSVGERGSMSGWCGNTNGSSSAATTYQPTKSVDFYFISKPLTLYKNT